MFRFFLCLLACVISLAYLPGYAVAASFTDESGKRFEVRKPFTRIISLYGGHTKNLFALGSDKEIIGVSQSENYPPQALQKPAFSYHEDAEKFMAARPDLVIIRPMIAASNPQFVEKLEKAGITVVSLQPVGISDMYEYWKNLGILTGKEEESRKMILKFQQSLEKIAASVKTIPQDKRKRVYFEAIHDKMRTFAPDSVAIFVLTRAGGINIASDAAQRKNTNIADFGKEKLLSRADDIDIYLAQSGTMNRITADRIKTEPGFSAIRAVKDNRIYLIDELSVSRPTPRLLQGIFDIGKILYPELFTDALWQEIR